MNQPNADPECLFCGRMQGHASTSTNTIFYDKYSTVSGFSQFTSEIVRTGVKYLRTQTHDSDLEWFTVTDSASFASAAATNPNLISLTKEFFDCRFWGCWLKWWSRWGGCCEKVWVCAFVAVVSTRRRKRCHNSRVL